MQSCGRVRLTHTHIRKHAHAHAHTRKHARTHTNAHTQTHASRQTHAHTHTHTQSRLAAFTVSAYCMSNCVCVCVWVRTRVHAYTLPKNGCNPYANVATLSPRPLMFAIRAYRPAVQLAQAAPCCSRPLARGLGRKCCWMVSQITFTAPSRGCLWHRRVAFGIHCCVFLNPP